MGPEVTTGVAVWELSILFCCCCCCCHLTPAPHPCNHSSQGLREITKAEGAVLCFDEVMTGFRIAKVRGARGHRWRRGRLCLVSV